MDTIDEKVLTLQQRIRRGQIMRSHSKRIERARELAKKHMAPDKNIKNRAYVQARQIVRRKVAGARGADYASLGATEKMMIDKIVEKKQKAIKKLALRLIPRVKSAEQKRLSTYIKHQSFGGSGGGPAASPGAAMTEEINNRFSEAFPAQKAKTIDDIKPTAKPKDKSEDAVLPDATDKGDTRGNSNVIMYTPFDKEANVMSPIYKAISKKAQKTGSNTDTLGEVYNRGMKQWNESMGVGQQQYAFARVNSFINHGRTYFEADYDLAELSAISSPDADSRKWNDQMTDRRWKMAADRNKNREKKLVKTTQEGFNNWTVSLKPGDKTKVLSGDCVGKKGVVVSKHDGGESYTIRHTDGSKMRHHISTLSEPITEDSKVAEEVTTGDYKGVVVVTPSGKIIIRKQKVNRSIITSGNTNDGKPDENR